MTVTYTSEVSTSTGLGCFLKLLRRWRGSIYKIVWADLILFLAIYYALNLSYLYAMNQYTKEHFVKVVNYCAKNGNLIPLSFVLGFFVNIVYSRWWSQFQAIPYPDNLALLIGANIKGQDERARIVRRTIVRYVCVTFTITLTLVSPKVKKRFPTLNHFVDAGLLTKEEKRIFEDLDNEYPNYTKNWLPLAWAANITTRARHEGIIRDDCSVKCILEQINIFRTKCGEMLAYDWISIPLVYTQVKPKKPFYFVFLQVFPLDRQQLSSNLLCFQVVTIAVYTYFLLTVIGNQFIDVEQRYVDRLIFSFPFMPVLEFFFYMGWLKVAETLINPFGEDDDDFDVVWMIDRHIQVCYLLVDKIHQDHPKLKKDYYWQQTAPDTLPFTVASQQYMKDTPVQSAENLQIKKTDQDLIIREEVHHQQPSRSFWSTLSDVFAHRRHGDNKYYLRRIAVDDNAEIFDEVLGGGLKPIRKSSVNTYEEEGPNKIKIPIYIKTKCNENVEEFDCLRKQRLEHQRTKLLKYVELLKDNKGQNGAETIVESIIK